MGRVRYTEDMPTCHNAENAEGMVRALRGLSVVEVCANTRRPGTWIAFLTDEQLQALRRAVQIALEVTQGKAPETIPCP